MQLNRESWTWSFSAMFHASARDALALGPSGKPVELEVRVNGQPASDEALRLDLGPGQELLANFPVGRYPAGVS